MLKSYTGFLTRYGTYRVVGELKNIGTRVIGNIYVEVSFYDEEGGLIFSSVTKTELTVLSPGRTTPFTCELTNKTQASRVHHCNVQIYNYTEVQSKQALLRLYAYYDLAGVRGEILSTGGSTTRSIRIIATFYDKDGRVIETSLDVIYQLDPWTPVEYIIFYPPPDASSISIFRRARYYSVTAESIDYISENEIRGEFRFSPFADFSVYPGTNASIGETLTFNASSSFDLDGEIVSYLWDFGDGSSAEGLVATHSYTMSGNFSVKLTVIDNDRMNST
ncbi:MAG: PKD domain-containing protein, partial [Candidatus Jordarchaeaceae archaeon]